MVTKQRTAKAGDVDVQALAQRVYPYYLRKATDGDEEGAAKAAITSAEVFAEMWANHRSGSEADGKGAE